MAECESDHSLIGLFDLLAQRDPSKPGARVKIPSTITYRHGTMHSWFYSDKETGQISRRDKKHCSKEDIVAVFGAAAGPCAATVVFQKKGFLEEDVGLNATSMEFLAPEALPLFVNKGGKRPDMLLQKFVQPLLNQNGGVEVIWTPYVCLVDHRKNVHDMFNDHYTLHDRCVTLEGKAHQAAEVFTGPAINRRCAAVCEEMARHLQAQERRHLLRLVAYFKFDKYGDIVFLWATNVITQRLSVSHGLSPKAELELASPRPGYDPDAPVTPSSVPPPRNLTDLKAFVQSMTPKIYNQSDTPSPAAFAKKKSVVLHKLPEVGSKGPNHGAHPHGRLIEGRRRPLMNLTPKYTFPAQATEVDSGDDDYCIMREPQVGDWNEKRKVGLLQYERLSAAAEAALRAVDEGLAGGQPDLSSPRSRMLRSTVSTLSPLRLTSASAPTGFYDSQSFPLSPASPQSGCGTPFSAGSLLSFKPLSCPLPALAAPPRTASDRPFSPLSVLSSRLSKRPPRRTGWGRVTTRSTAHRSSAALRMWAQHALFAQQQAPLNSDTLAEVLPSPLRYCRGGGGGFYLPPSPGYRTLHSPQAQPQEAGPDEEEDDDEDEYIGGLSPVAEPSTPHSSQSPHSGATSGKGRRRTTCVSPQAAVGLQEGAQEGRLTGVHAVPLQQLLAVPTDTVPGNATAAADAIEAKSVFVDLQRPELHHRHQRALRLHRLSQAWLEDVCYSCYSQLLDTQAPLTVEVPPSVALWIGYVLAAFLPTFHIPVVSCPGAMEFTIDPTVTSPANLGKALQRLKAHLHYCFLSEERRLVDDALEELRSPVGTGGPTRGSIGARRRVAAACDARLQEIDPELRRLRGEGAAEPPVLGRPCPPAPGPLSWPEGELLRMEVETEG
eukprot:EG_transcript_2597